MTLFIFCRDKVIIKCKKLRTMNMQIEKAHECNDVGNKKEWSENP